MYSNYSCSVRDNGTTKSSINVYVLVKEPINSAVVREQISISAQMTTNLFHVSSDLLWNFEKLLKIRQSQWLH